MMAQRLIDANALSIPLNIVVFAVAGVEMLMDMIRAYQDRRRANNGQHS